MKPLYVITTLAAMAVSGCMTTPEQGTSPTNIAHETALDLYSYDFQVTLVSNVKLPKHITEKFSEFRKGGRGYFGAFAYSAGSGHGARSVMSSGANTLKAAREQTLYICNRDFRRGPPCKIIAILTPKGYVAKPKMTLSRNITNILPSLRRGRKHSAIATSDLAFIDKVVGYDTQKNADAEALRLCTLRMKRRTPTHQKPYPCYLIPK